MTRILAGENREKEDEAALAVITIFVIFQGVTATHRQNLPNNKDSGTKQRATCIVPTRAATSAVACG